MIDYIRNRVDNQLLCVQETTDNIVQLLHLAKITNTFEPHHLVVLPTVRKDHLGPILAQPI